MFKKYDPGKGHTLVHTTLYSFLFHGHNIRTETLTANTIISLLFNICIHSTTYCYYI